MNSNNENIANEEVEVVHLDPVPFRPEVPAAMKGYTTPNRPTRNVFGKPGALPGALPARRLFTRTVAKVPHAIRNTKPKTRKTRTRKTRSRQARYTQ